ncbi:MAG: hypothetical protein WCK98_06650 [bacterium]
MNENSRKLIIIVLVIICFLTLGIGVYIVRVQSSKAGSDSSTSVTSQTSSKSKKPALGVKLDLPSFAGNYAGTSKLISESLVLLGSNFTLNQDQTFAFEKRNYDSTLTQIESLKINGVYPLVSVFISGKVEAKDDGSFDLVADVLKFEFNVEGKILNKQASQELLSGLREFGEIPDVSKDNPYNVNVTLEFSPQKISVKSTLTSKTYIIFDGQKQP